MMAIGGGTAWADHTKEDAEATTRKLQAILHPPKKAKPAPCPKPKPPVVIAATTEPRVEPAAARPVADPLYNLIVHALAIPFDDKEREAHLRDIPKNAKELDAHLRRLDAALAAQHHQAR